MTSPHLIPHRDGAAMNRVMPQLMSSEDLARSHHAGTFSSSVLARVEELLPDHELTRTAETGCGKSTILFSNISREHVVFCLDDRSAGDGSSVLYFEGSPLTRRERVSCVFGPTQDTLPAYRHRGAYDCVLLDGPHGYPFPELEYYQFYPHLRPGGFLILDDVHIPTIGRLADFLQEDDMFSLVEVVSTTAVFRRTESPVFEPKGDGWWQQKFNQRRTPADHEFHLVDGGERTSFLERMARPQRRPPPQRVSGAGARLRAAWRMLRRGE
jgi:methyltransferase family protein